MWQRIKWFLRGRPFKKITGGWCGLCGDWLPKAEFSFPDYLIVDNLYDLNTICGECKLAAEKVVATIGNDVKKASKLLIEAEA